MQTPLMQKAAAPLTVQPFSLKPTVSCPRHVSQDLRCFIWNHSLFKIVVVFFVLFIHFSSFFLKQHHKLSAKLDRSSDGGVGDDFELPRPERSSDDLMDERRVFLTPLEGGGGTGDNNNNNNNQVTCHAPPSGRLEGCTMLPLRSRWKSRFILHEREEKAKCKNLYCNSKKEKKIIMKK